MTTFDVKKALPLGAVDQLARMFWTHVLNDRPLEAAELLTGWLDQACSSLATYAYQVFIRVDENGSVGLTLVYTHSDASECSEQVAAMLFDQLALCPLRLTGRQLNIRCADASDETLWCTAS